MFWGLYNFYSFWDNCKEPGFLNCIASKQLEEPYRQSCPDSVTFKYHAPNKKLFCLRFNFKTTRDYCKGTAVETAWWMLISNPSRSKVSLQCCFPYLFKFSEMDNLFDSDDESRGLDWALSKKAGKQIFWLKCMQDETWRNKTIIMYKTHFSHVT